MKCEKSRTHAAHPPWQKRQEPPAAVGGRVAWWLDRFFLAEARPLFDHLPNETAMFLSGYGTRITPAYLGGRRTASAT